MEGDAFHEQHNAAAVTDRLVTVGDVVRLHELGHLFGNGLVVAGEEFAASRFEDFHEVGLATHTQRVERSVLVVEEKAIQALTRFLGERAQAIGRGQVLTGGEFVDAVLDGLGAAGIQGLQHREAFSIFAAEGEDAPRL